MKSIAALWLVLGLVLCVNGQNGCQNGGVLSQGGTCECLPGFIGDLCQDRSGDFCTLPAEPGPCKALFRRFYHNSTDGTCKQFNYGGCQGNANNFETQEECEKQSTAMCTPMPMPNAFCSQAPETGRCRANMIRYHYDSETQTCKQFVYGGCGGNKNNFKTQEECNMRGEICTGKFCDLPKETGMCRAYFRSWYFNSAKGSCEEFIYGGCRGNSNRFSTKKGCEGAAIPMCTRARNRVMQMMPDSSGSMKAGFLAVLLGVMLSLAVRMH